MEAFKDWDGVSELCRCPGWLASILPDPATATPDELLAHAEHLRRLAAVGSLPDPAFQPYPPLCSLQKTS